MTDAGPRVRLHDVHISGAADPDAVRAAIERAVARSLGGGNPPGDSAAVQEAIAEGLSTEPNR